MKKRKEFIGTHPKLSICQKISIGQGQTFIKFFTSKNANSTIVFNQKSFDLIKFFYLKINLLFVYLDFVIS